MKTKTKTMTPLKKTKSILLFGLFTMLFTGAFAQLDTKHWIPPFYAKPGPGSGTSNLRDHFVSLSTPTEDTIPVVIRDGFENLIDTVWISRDTPQEYYFSPTGNANTDTYPLNVIPTDSLNMKIRSQGLYFSSYQPFFVNMRHKAGSQGFSLTSKGQVALGDRFYSGHIHTIYNNSDVWNNERRSHFISVMATEDNTVITFDMIKDPINYIGHTQGEDIVVTLDAFESYTIGVDHSLYDNATINNANGTRITSTKPIVCNSGSWLSGNESGQCIGADQLVPAEVTGQEYILVRGLGDETTERPMVVATEDNTDVFINGSATPAVTLDEGEFYFIPTADFSTDDNMYVLATEKVFMFQTLSGSATEIGPTVGLNFIPPLNCIGAKEVVLPFVNSLAANDGEGRINIVTKAGTTIYVNESGAPLTGESPVPGNPDWVTYSFNPPSDNVILESDSVMNVALLTRDGVVGSAGYFSGFTLEPVVGLSTGVTGTLPCIPGNAVMQVFGFDAYQWYFNGEEIEGATGSTLFPEFAGDYMVEGLDLACGFRFPSNSFTIPYCPSTLGSAKAAQSVVETAPGSRIFDITYQIFVENLAESASQNIQVIESINGGLPAGATAELIGSPTLTFGILTGGVNPDFDGVTDRRLLPGNGSLPGGAADAINLVIRIDMNGAEQDGYFDQVTVTSKDGVVNNGIDGPFNGQDFSHAGTNPDPNGNGEPNEDGENDPTLTCFFTHDITYDAESFCTADAPKVVEIDGVNSGVFTVDVEGLNIDPITGTIDPSLSDPGTYIVTFNTDGRCPTETTTEVTIVQLPDPGTEASVLELCVTDDAVNLSDFIEGEDEGGSWTDSDGTPIPDGTFDPFAPGTFGFIYTVEAAPCDPQSIAIDLTVVPEPNPGMSIENPLVCAGDGQADLDDFLEGQDAGGEWTDEDGTVLPDGIITLSDAGIETYFYTVSNAACGERSSQLDLNVIAVPDAGVPLGDPIMICAGEDLNLFDFLVGADDDGVWTDSEGEDVDPTEPIYEIGTQTYTYTIDRTVCEVATTSINVEVVEGPSAGEPLDPTPLCSESEAVNLINFMPGADAGGIWTDEDDNEVPGFFKPEGEGTYMFTYTVTSPECGNIRKDLNLDVSEENCFDDGIVIPEGFSPNGDGYGDFWIIGGLEYHPDHTVTIFNRWGSVVFSASPYNNNWDGKSDSGLNSGEPLPVGTYFYTIEFGGSDETKSMSGYIYLNR